ncbi:MAG: hypothetical protein PHG55_11815, partial [Verrucomicrobiota bacterium]|nr:hypothetical protein [Verrucomicrobiota bacterium]
GWCWGSGPGGRKPGARGASGEVGGPQHSFACCCTGPGGPARGRRSAMGGGMAMGLRTLDLLMGDVGG